MCCWAVGGVAVPDCLPGTESIRDLPLFPQCVRTGTMSVLDAGTDVARAFWLCVYYRLRRRRALLIQRGCAGHALTVDSLACVGYV
jgi:hypothetical protein